MEKEQMLRPHETIARIILPNYAEQITPEKHEMIVKEVDNLLAMLPEDQKLIIEYYYGFKDGKYTLLEISKLLSKKLGDIIALKKKAIDWMSHPNNSFGVYMALDGNNFY